MCRDPPAPCIRSSSVGIMLLFIHRYVVRRLRLIAEYATSKNPPPPFYSDVYHLQCVYGVFNFKRSNVLKVLPFVNFQTLAKS